MALKEKMFCLFWDWFNRVLATMRDSMKVHPADAVMNKYMLSIIDRAKKNKRNGKVYSKLTETQELNKAIEKSGSKLTSYLN